MATLNEPNVAALLGHGTGVHAPGLADRDAALKAIHHLNLAHGRAIAALRDADAGLSLGVVNNLHPAVAASDGAADKDAAALADAYWNRAFADPQFLGRYPELLEPLLAPYIEADDLKSIKQPLDFFGLNHYSPNYIRHDPDAALGFALADPPEGRPVTGMGWEVRPDVFRDLLLDVHRRYGRPIYVTENGAGYEETPDAAGRVRDGGRVAYLAAYLAAVHEAVAAGADVRGYFVWSLLDNFEWAFGYAKRFASSTSTTRRNGACPKTRSTTTTAWWRPTPCSRRPRTAS